MSVLRNLAIRSCLKIPSTRCSIRTAIPEAYFSNEFDGKRKKLLTHCVNTHGH